MVVAPVIVNGASPEVGPHSEVFLDQFFPFVTVPRNSSGSLVYGESQPRGLDQENVLLVNELDP